MTRTFNLFFLGVEGEPVSATATLTEVSDTEQTLEVSADEGRPYYIVGKKNEEAKVFVGKNYGPKGDPHVFARWTVDDGSMMGVWVEDEAMFAFTGFLDESDSL